jgi:ceramide glucosyltransferase
MDISIVFAALTVLGLIAYTLQLLAVRYYGRSDAFPLPEDAQPSPAVSGALPPISILKPMKGLDDNLFDNLESFCRLDYPEYEIIFALQNWNDPAYKVAEKVKEKYPDLDITIHVENYNPGLNPKVNNLIPAYRISKYPTILISDSNITVDKDYLRNITRELSDPSVGLVCNLISGMGGYSLGAIFENLHMNSFILGSVCFLSRFLKMPCVIGKSMLMRKKDLETVGGLEAFKNVLAEDYLIGKRMKETGRKVIISGSLISNVNNYWGALKFINRHTRWAKLRWQIGGFRYLSEMIANPVFMSVLYVLLAGPSKSSLIFAGTVSAYKIAGDFMIGRMIGANLKPVYYLFSPLKDLLIGFLWFAPLLSSTVVWRGNRYIIGKDSVLAPCPEHGIWALKYRLYNGIANRLTM